MIFPHGRLLLRTRSDRRAAGTAVKAGTIIHRGIIDNSCIVDDRSIDISVVYDRRIYIYDSGVVMKGAATPFAPHKTRSSVSVTIVNASIEPYMETPISRMPSVNAACVTPISRRPKVPRHRRAYPNTGHPIISIDLIVCPITGTPQVAVHRTGRLRIHRQGRRRRPDIYAYG